MFYNLFQRGGDDDLCAVFSDPDLLYVKENGPSWVKLGMLYTWLPRSMPNADQYRSMPIKIVLLIPMPIKKDQWRSMLIKLSQYFSIKINRHWSPLIFIERYFGKIPQFWSVLIGGVLFTIMLSCFWPLSSWPGVWLDWIVLSCSMWNCVLI